MVKPGYYAEKRRIDEMKKNGWTGFRVSGSIGPNDIVFVRRNPFTKELEVRIEQIKSTKKNKFYFDKRAKSEWNRLYEISKKLNIPCYFVIYYIGKRKKEIIKIDKPFISERKPTEHEKKIIEERKNEELIPLKALKKKL